MSSTLEGGALLGSTGSFSDGAFEGCTGLTNISIGNGVTSIGSWAFSGCTSLTGISIPNSVTAIGNYAFSRCTSLASVSIGNGVISIGDAPFSGCQGLLQIEVAAENPAYHSMEGSLFDKAVATLIQYPGGRVGSYAIPGTVTAIGDYAFSGCTGLTSVSLPNSVTSIGYEAFFGCTGLTSVSIGNGVSEIGSGAFSGCRSLLQIEVAADNPAYRSVEGILFDKAVATLIQYPGGRVGSYAIPGTVTAIGDYAFSGCTGLTSVSLPNSVTSIGYEAFFGCTGLTGVIIPDSAISIGSYAFEGCTGLTSVTFEGHAPAYFGGEVFANTAPGFTIFYYEASAGFTSPAWRGYPTVALSRPPVGDGELIVASLTRQGVAVAVGGKAGLTSYNAVRTSASRPGRQSSPSVRWRPTARWQ